jgi:hypothetical protein
MATPKVTVSLRLTPAELERIDVQRAHLTRTDYMTRAIRVAGRSAKFAALIQSPASDSFIVPDIPQTQVPCEDALAGAVHSPHLLCPGLAAGTENGMPDELLAQQDASLVRGPRGPRTSDG